MPKKPAIKLKCPHCNLPAAAQLEDNYHKFIIYECPKCLSNVVFYDNKIDTISDKLLRKLKKGFLKNCGMISFGGNKKQAFLPSTDKGKGISDEDVLNLKILLETERDSSKIIDKL